MHRKLQITCAALCAILLAFAISPALAQQQGTAPPPNPLVELLKSKGILTAAEAASIQQAPTSAAANQQLADVLLQHGILSQTEHDRLTAQAPQVAQVAPPPPPVPSPQPSILTKSQNIQAPPFPTEPGAPAVVALVPTRELNPALTPIRPFPLGGVKLEEHPAFKADGVGITPYGFVKATLVEDSSSPGGDDFPLPGFLSDTGPDGSPEFHIKARSSRFGGNFQWYDHNPKWVITGKIELDLEGNFNRSDNRNLSSVRSYNPSVRLAYGRLDYHYDANNTFSAVIGQDWTTFGSSTLPNILETTGLGIAFGALWERDPQMRVGFSHKQGSFAIMPEFAIDLPVSGLPPSAANMSNQLGYGERQGPDSNRPEYQARLVFQGQLDHAKGVPPAQLIFSGFEGRRTAIVLAAAVPTATLTTPNYHSVFPTGVSAGSKQDGWDAEWQLPTRFFTLTGKFYSGSDLRFFFAGQLYSFFNDTKGLTQTVTVASEDGASNIIFGVNAAGQMVVAPQRPVRSQGGFAQLGLPLSRIFNADPAGRNAGWSFYALYGVDQAKTRDLNESTLKGNRRDSTMAVGTLNYQLNHWISFSYEQSLYTTHANPYQALPLFRGVPSREWNDIREEAGPTFTF